MILNKGYMYKIFKFGDKTYRIRERLLTFEVEVKDINGRYKHVAFVKTEQQAMEVIKHGKILTWD